MSMCVYACVCPEIFESLPVDRLHRHRKPWSKDLSSCHSRPMYNIEETEILSRKWVGLHVSISYICYKCIQYAQNLPLFTSLCTCRQRPLPSESSLTPIWLIYINNFSQIRNDHTHQKIQFSPVERDWTRNCIHKEWDSKNHPIFFGFFNMHLSSWVSPFGIWHNVVKSRESVVISGCDSAPFSIIISAMAICLSMIESWRNHSLWHRA